MELEKGQLVKATLCAPMTMGIQQGIVKDGDTGLITKVCERSGILPGLYRVYWLSGTASGDWWMVETFVSALEEDDNEV